MSLDFLIIIGGGPVGLIVVFSMFLSCAEGCEKLRHDAKHSDLVSSKTLTTTDDLNS